LQASSLGDQVVAMVDQQAHLARRAVELGDRQIGLAPCRAGDGERVDRVRLAACSSAAPDAGHHLRRDPEDLLAGAQQGGFQRAREVPAVLQRPPPSRPPGCPADRGQVPVGCRRQGLGRDFSSEFVGRHQRVRALVRIDADYYLR
jgi:hypothetical protein